MYLALFEEDFLKNALTSLIIVFLRVWEHTKDGDFVGCYEDDLV